MTGDSRKKRRDPIDEEIINKGRAVVNDFDYTQEIRVKGMRPESRMISIRLPMDMIEDLRKVARSRGDMGYQQVIKFIIRTALEREKVAAAKLADDSFSVSDRWFSTTSDSIIYPDFGKRSCVSGRSDSEAA